MSAIDQAMSGLRKRSIANVELQDDSGRRRTVQLDDLSEEDRALAEKFGYKPVSRPLCPLLHALLPPDSNCRRRTLHAPDSHISRSSNVTLDTWPHFPLPSPSLASSPPSPPLLSIPCRPVALPRPSGPGSSLVPVACALPAPSPNSCPLTLPAAACTIPSPVWLLALGSHPSVGSSAGSTFWVRSPASLPLNMAPLRSSWLLYVPPLRFLDCYTLLTRVLADCNG